MATVTIECPECQARLKITDLEPGTRIRCPKCKNPFPVPEEDEEETRSQGIKAGVARKPAPRRDVDEEDIEERSARRPEKWLRDDDDSEDDDEDRPARKAARRRDEDEDDDRPRRRQGRRETDDEEEDRPRRKKLKKKKKQGNPALLWGLIGGGVLLLAGGAVALMIVLNSGGGTKGNQSGSGTGTSEMNRDLGPETSIQMYRIQLPKGYQQASQQNIGTVFVTSWTGPAVANQAPPVLTFTLVPKGPADPPMSLGTFRNFMAGFKSTFAGTVNDSAAEQTKINGLDFVRARLTGSSKGKSFQGWIYVGQDEQKGIIFMALCFDPVNSKDLTLAEAAAATIKKP